MEHLTRPARAQGGIRPARPQDVPVVLQLVRELAAYERAPDAVETTEAMLHDALFGDAPVASCHVATDPAGKVVGFALWYVTFSTWKGRPGMWLEDLFVRPQARGSGLGRALLETLAGVCVERGYARFEWWVLDWNAPAHGFYRSLGARPEDEWTVWRVDGEELDRLGARSAQPPAEATRAAAASPSAVAARQAAVVPSA